MADIAIQYPISQIFVDCELTGVRSQLNGAVAPTQGQAIYTDPTTGTILATDATNAAKVAFRGVVIERGGPGAGVTVVEKGYLGGYDLTALAYDAPVYLSNTPGALSSTAGTNSTVVGRVVAMSDKDPVTFKPSKALFIRPSVI